MIVVLGSILNSGVVAILFHCIGGAVDPADSEDDRLRELNVADPAEAIPGLRVPDPTMGSGRYLVGLVDTLSAHVLDAMAEVAVASGHDGYACGSCGTIAKAKPT